MESFDWAMLVLRTGIGLVIMTHGVNHARGRQRTTAWFGSIGFRHAELQWLASTLSELAIGTLLILGFLTGPAAAGLISVMFVAFWSVHRGNGFFIFRPGEGWEYVGTLALIAATIALAGPGAASLDNGIGIDTAFNGWSGAALIAGGLVAAAGQLAIFFRPEQARTRV